MKFFISVGEPSGDVLAAELCEEIFKFSPSSQGFGIVGPRLKSTKVEELATIDELSVMGFTDVIKHLPHIKRLESQLLIEIQRRQPDVAILVDYPGFHLRLAESLKALGIQVVQYVAPQLWAWGEKRTKRLKRVTDLVLGIMPFEQAFFRDRGVNYKYVGTPQVDRVARLEKDLRLDSIPGSKLIGFFPGSRWGEVSRILPKMKELRANLRRRKLDLHFAVSVAPSLNAEAFEGMLEPSKLSDFHSAMAAQGGYTYSDTSFVKGSSLALMDKVDVALVASGTATLECALCFTPMAVAYVMNNISYKIAKHLVKLDYISLVNLVAKKGLISEFIQDFSIDALADHMQELVFNKATRESMQNDLKALKRELKGDLAFHASREIFAWLESSENVKIS